MIETDIDFIWRKLRWTVQNFLTEEIYPAFFTFIRRARISSLTVQHPFYKGIIQFAYKSLQSDHTLGEQIPEDLRNPDSSTVMSHDRSVNTAAFGSLASIFIDSKLNLQKPLKREKERVYELHHLLLLTVAAIVSGADTYVTIALWGYRNEDLLRMFGFPQGQFPCKETLKRLRNNVYVDSFESILETWLRDNFLEIKVSETETTNAKKDSLPGIQLLRAYRHIAPEVIEKLY